MNLQIRIVDGPVPPMDLWDVPGAGAIISFAGNVRPTEHDQPIHGLEYEAYQPMAQRQIEIIARELIESHKLLGMRIEHSVGWVPVGQCSFRLEIAGRHRAEALSAMAEFIDRLKRDVPIWKNSK
ncbi:MAG: molybdenum cofactor biosynthesis protein MoaE [Tepidisphaeraceae bacterium]|jgi:molybdopterin synthase catalytic subunit